MMRFIEDFGVEVKSGYLIDIVLTHQEIANLMGSSRITVTKQLNQFIDEGIIKIHQRKIVVLDIENWQVRLKVPYKGLLFVIKNKTRFVLREIGVYIMGKANMKKKQVESDFFLVIVVAIWGSTLPIIKLVLPDIDSLYFIALRFTLAFFFLSLIYRKHFARLNRRAFLRLHTGLIFICWLCISSIGLKYTTAARSGFITGLAVVIVPFIPLYLKEKSGFLQLSGAALAAGFIVHDRVGRARIYPGDYLCLLCAISFALQIVLLSKYLSLGEEPILLTLVQMGVVAVGAGFFSLFTNSSYHLNLPTIGVLVYTGLLATAFAYLIQSYAQTFIPASRAGLIFAMEPVFGALFSYLILGKG